MSGSLRLVVTECDTALPRTGAAGQREPFVKLSLLALPPAVIATTGAVFQTPPATNDSTSPVWDTPLEVGINLAEPATLRVELFDRVADSADELLATGIVDLNRIVPGWETVGSISPAVFPEDLGDGSCAVSLSTVGSSLAPNEELRLVLARVEFVPDEATAAVWAQDSKVLPMERRPLPPHFKELGPRPRTGTLFVVMQPFENAKEVMDGAAVYLEGDNDGALNEVTFATRMTTLPEELRGPFDDPCTESEIDAASDMNKLSMTWVEEDGEVALPSSIAIDLAHGRSVVVEGHECMLQTAKMKFRRVRVINGVDEASVNTAKAAQKEAELEACESVEDRAKLMLTHAQDDEATIARANDVDDQYETVDFTDCEPDVAAFLTALHMSLYRPPAAPAPEPEPEPTATDIGEDELTSAAEEAGIEVTEDMSPDDIRAALEEAYKQTATDRALAAAMAAKLAAEEELGSLDRNKVAQLKTYKVPPTAVHAVLQAVLLLLGYSAKKAGDWAGARQLVGTDEFWPSLAEYDVETATREKTLKKKRAGQVMQLLEAAGGETGAERASIVALVLYKWCQGCMDVYSAVKKQEEMAAAAAAAEAGEDGEAAEGEEGAAAGDAEDDEEDDEEEEEEEAPPIEGEEGVEGEGAEPAEPPEPETAERSHLLLSHHSVEAYGLEVADAAKADSKESVRSFCVTRSTVSVASTALLGGGEEYAEGLGLELPEDKPEDDALDLSLVAVRSSLSLVYFISSLFLLGSVCCGVRRRC